MEPGRQRAAVAGCRAGERYPGGRWRSGDAADRRRWQRHRSGAVAARVRHGRTRPPVAGPRRQAWDRALPVKELVGLHGGSITVESTGMASGARFTVALPLRRDNVRETDEGRFEAKPLKAVHVLMVDEDTSTNDAFQALLSTEGAQVTCTDSSEEAIRIVEDRAIDVVLSGLNPAGRSASLSLRPCAPSLRTPTCLSSLSAVVQRGGMQGAMQNGYSAYLTKPIVLDELVAAIARVRASRDE